MHHVPRNCVSAATLGPAMILKRSPPERKPTSQPPLGPSLPDRIPCNFVHLMAADVFGGMILIVVNMDVGAPILPQLLIRGRLTRPCFMNVLFERRVPGYQL